MIRRAPTSNLFAAFAIAFAAASQALAQFPAGEVSRAKPPNRPARSGEIVLSDMSGGQFGSSVQAGQQQTLEHYKQLFQFVSNAKGGNLGRPPIPGEKVIWYLGGVYLYCVIREGTCPYILDTILEVDVANARLDKSDKCPSMVGFWKTYLGNGMEDRHKYQTKTGYLSMTVDFNQKVRPKYVKCQQTVRAENSGGTSDQEYFKLRYRQSSQIIESMQRTLKYLEAIKAANVNVFIETGAVAGQATPAR